MFCRLECTVSGRVRGVMYRDTTARCARRLAITGFVQNQDDGTVHVVAEGEEGALQTLLLCLQKGSPLSRVDHVEEVWGNATGEFPDFRIRYRNFLDRL